MVKVAHGTKAIGLAASWAADQMDRDVVVRIDRYGGGGLVYGWRRRTCLGTTVGAGGFGLGGGCDKEAWGWGGRTIKRLAAATVLLDDGPWDSDRRRGMGR
ncbi:unnamed protein product [Cuscuta epithymum]|uniref:Uncharacterized protein n=1 Tax=Cuscuta epithymum TaxID=186058 RepID=A0AAV0FB68_9ASTE|nr:unnamed protein product [Cuscuta epithymum]